MNQCSYNDKVYIIAQHEPEEQDGFIKSGASQLFIIWLAGMVATDHPRGGQNRSFQFSRLFEYHWEGLNLRDIADNLPNITHSSVDRQIKIFTELAKGKAGSLCLDKTLHFASSILTEDDCDSIFKVFLGLLDISPRVRAATTDPYANILMMHQSTPCEAFCSELIGTGCRRSDIDNTTRALFKLDRYLSEGGN
ncbi:hypothetical protein P4B35_22660 [Pontiellaceae bacterium B12227]|nr:hypothetical protein [Pontiellaceae bacterium B12227]